MPLYFLSFLDVPSIISLYGENEDIGIKSGLTNLDNILGKFQAGRMIGIFARSGVGKSTVAIQIALNMA